MEGSNDRPLAITILSAFMGLTALLTALFWILFFSNKIEATETEQDDAFEHAFPLADSWMIATSLVAAPNLIKMNRKGFFAGVASGSAMIFLACMDILYSLENKKYWPLNGDRAQMLVIHTWTISLGATVLCLLWKHRDAFKD